MVAAVRGYRLILTMPDDMSVERRTLLSLYGAKLVLTPAIEGMSVRCSRPSSWSASTATSCPSSFSIRMNPEIHRRTTAREILEATDGEIDAIVVGVGTGGTITGVGEVLERSCAQVRQRCRS